MNILMTTLLDLENDRNGVVSVARDLGTLLTAAGHAVQVVSPSNESPPDRNLIKRLTKRLWRYTRSPVWFQAGLIRALNRLGRRLASCPETIDAVIAHDVLTADASLRALGGQCPILLVCHFWTAPWEEFAAAGLLPTEGRSGRWLRGRMERTLNDPRLVLVPVSGRNEQLLRRLVPEVPPERIRRAYPGVLPQQTPLLSERKRNDCPVIINVGTLDRRKNQRLLPPLAHALRQRGVTCHFVLAGEELPEEKAFLLEEMARLQVAGLFTCRGKEDRGSVFRLMSEADLYLHTSHEESFGMTLVEAMACHTPVMALEYLAVHELMPDTPEAIIPFDAPVERIAEILAPFLTDRTRLASLQSRQRAVFDRCFSAEAFVARYLEIIEGEKRS